MASNLLLLHVRIHVRDGVVYTLAMHARTMPKHSGLQKNKRKVRHANRQFTAKSATKRLRITNNKGTSVNKEYLSQLQLYSIFGELPVLSNTVLIIIVCVKVANSTFLVTNKRTVGGLSYRCIIYATVS